MQIDGSNSPIPKWLATIPGRDLGSERRSSGGGAARPPWRPRHRRRCGGPPRSRGRAPARCCRSSRIRCGSGVLRRRHCRYRRQCFAEVALLSTGGSAASPMQRQRRARVTRSSPRGLGDFGRSVLNMPVRRSIQTCVVAARRLPTCGPCAWVRGGCPGAGDGNHTLHSVRCPAGRSRRRRGTDQAATGVTRLGPALAWDAVAP